MVDMLSKLGLGRVLLKDASDKVSLVSVRLFKDYPPASFKPTSQGLAGGNEDLARNLANWEYANSLFNSPQRDLKNFPNLGMPERCPPVRLGFIPETWFQSLYEKTGVTGPYFLGGGLLTFLLSKEIIIMEHNLAHFYTFWLAAFLVHYKYGKKISDYINKETEKFNEEFFEGPARRSKDIALKNIADLELSIKYEGSQKYLWEAKKENVDLQLESAYRQRLTEVYQTVKKRLDYHVEVENVHKRLEQQHMVDWITRNVVKGITPQQEKDSILKCIADLKSLAAKQQVAAA